MSRTVSISQMIEALDGLRDTKDVTPWESEFITGILHRYLTAGKTSTVITAKQVEVIERIWRKHFA